MHNTTGEMSYSDTLNLIEEKGLESAFDIIYSEYKQAKDRFAEMEQLYNEAKTALSIKMNMAHNFVHRAAQLGMGECIDGDHFVRKIVGNEYVYFKSNGTNYAIGYEALTDLTNK